uniref:Exocyst complex component 3 like 2 n=1 Tax=Aquila chrysaetos chrysaetos TaxID=223781 RepID=A0A663FKV7_AQUCH
MWDMLAWGHGHGDGDMGCVGVGTRARGWGTWDVLAWGHGHGDGDVGRVGVGTRAWGRGTWGWGHGTCWRGDTGTGMGTWNVLVWGHGHGDGDMGCVGVGTRARGWGRGTCWRGDTGNGDGLWDMGPQGAWDIMRWGRVPWAMGGLGCHQSTHGCPPPPPKKKKKVLEILELIQRQELVAADEQIIALEAECMALSPSPVPTAGRQVQDMSLLYEALLAQLWVVVGEAVPAGRPYPPLHSVIRVLEQEEAADRRHPPGTPGRPRALQPRWQEAVGRAAGERLAQVAPAAGLGARLAALAAQLVGDLGAVRCHVAPAYPPEYSAFGVYACGYHRALAQQLGALAQRPLVVPNLYLLLDWHNTKVPRYPIQMPGCQGAPRGWWSCWYPRGCHSGGRVPRGQQSGGRCPYPQRCLCPQLLRAHVDRAPQITPEFGMEMAHSLLGVLVAFLHSFQRKVEWFLEAPSEATPPDGATSLAIALVNCCPPFRTFAEHLAQFGHPESEEPRCQAHATLDKVTRLCNHILTQHLFEDLKPYFNKLMKHKWLTSSDAFDTIVMLITSFTQKLCPLRPEPYQVLVSKVHRQVLIEYMQPLLQVRLVCTSAKMRARVAARLGNEAHQLRELFSHLDSASPWLDSVVPRLRELLVLEDTVALQMEVGVLVRDFPDVRQKHVVAVLDVWGLRGQAARLEILGVVQDLEQSKAEPGLPCQCAAFSELAVAREVPCLPFHLPRLARLSHLHLRCLYPQCPGQAQL